MAALKDLQDAYLQLRGKKAEKKALAQSFKDELEHDAGYQEVLEQMKQLREKKKQIENECYARAMQDVARLEELKSDVKSQEILISDIAINLYMQNETVELVDEYNNVYEPSFVVRFKKSGELRSSSAPSMAPAEVSEEEAAPEAGAALSEGLAAA